MYLIFGTTALLEAVDNFLVRRSLCFKPKKTLSKYIIDRLLFDEYANVEKKKFSPIGQTIVINQKLMVRVRACNGRAVY